MNSGKIVTVKHTLAFLLLGCVVPAWADSPRLAGESRRTLERCDEAAELVRKHHWDDALAAYLKIIDDAGDDWAPTAVDPKLWRPARAVISARIAANPELLRRYRARFDAEANRQLAEASARRDLTALKRLTAERGPSTAAARAWDEMGDLAFEAGDFAAARHAWRQVGDAPLAHAKVILAGLFLGESQESAIAGFRGRHAAAHGRLAGRDGDLAAILEQLSREIAPAPVATGERAFSVDASRRGQLADPIPAGAPDVVLSPIGLPAPAEPSSSDNASGPAAAPTTVYHPLIWKGQAVVSDGVRVLAYDLRSGEESHTFEMSGPRRGPRDGGTDGPPEPTTLASDGTRLFARLGTGEASQVVALTTSTGDRFRFQPAWSLAANRVAEPEAGVPAVDGCPTPSNGKLYLAWSRTNANRVTHGITCVWADAPGDKPLWRHAVAESTRELVQRSGPVLLTIAGPNVVMNTDAGAVIALDAESGQRVWAYRYAQRPTKDIGLDLMRVARDVAPCVASNGRVFAAPADCGDILCLDQFTGEPLWPQPLGLEVVHVLGTAGERLFITADGQQRGIGAINIARGRLDPRWGSLTSERPLGRGLLFSDGVLWPTRSQGLIPLRFDQQPVPIPTVFQRLPGGNLAYADGCLLLTTEKQLHILRWKQPRGMAVQPVRPATQGKQVRLIEPPTTPAVSSLTPRRVTELPPNERPLLAEAADILATADGHVVWRHVPSGEMRWKTPLEFNPTWAAAAETGYIIAGAGGVAALDRVTGTALWVRRADESFAGFRAADGRLFVTAGPRQIVALNLADGRPEWQHSVAPESVRPPLAIAGGDLIAQTSGGRARLLDLATGRWQATAPTTSSPWRSPPGRLPDEAVVLPGPIDRLTAIDPQSGEPFWSHDLASEIDSGGAAFATRWLDGSLWLLAETSVGGVLRLIDARTGRIAAADPKLPPVRGLTQFHHLARRDDSLVIAACDRLLGFDANTGRRRWTTTLPVSADWCVRPARDDRWLLYTAIAPWRWAEPAGGYQWTALLVDDRDGAVRQRHDLPAREPGVVTGGDARTWVVAVAGRTAEFETSGEAK